MVDQYQGQVEMVRALINKLAVLEQVMDDIDDLLQDYTRLQYNVNNFDIQSIQNAGLFVRSHFDEPATNNTLVHAVQGYNHIKSAYTEANAVNGNMSAASAIAIALEGIQRG